MRHLAIGLIAMAMLGGVVAPHTAMAQQKKRPPAPPPAQTPEPEAPANVPPPAVVVPAAPPLSYTLSRIYMLENQVAERLAVPVIPNPSQVLAARSDVNYRIFAATLLKIGAARGAEGALPLLYGHTLADHADEFQKLFAQVIATSGGDAKVGEAIGQFNQRCEQLTGALKQIPDPQMLDKYLENVLGPLTAVVKAAGAPDPMGAWPIAASDLASAGPQREPVTDQQISDLTNRIRTLNLPSNIKTDLMGMLQTARAETADPNAATRQRGEEFFDLISSAIELAQTIPSMRALGDSVVTEMNQQLRIGILLIREPRMRAGAAERFSAMLRLIRAASMIGELQKMRLPTDALTKLLVTAHQLQQNAADLTTSRLLLDFIRDVFEPAYAYRNTERARLVSDLQRVSVMLGRRYEQLEKELLDRLGELTEAPTMVSDAMWQDALAELRRSVREIDRVHMIPEWVNRLEKYKPVPSVGPSRRVRTVAAELVDADPQKRARAGRLIRQLEDHLEEFDPMPFEDRLTSPDEAIRRVTDGQSDRIVQQLIRLKQEWATAWGNPQVRMNEVVGKLRLIGRLLRAIDVTAMVYELEAVTAKLNRWGGWQASAEAVGGVMSTMPMRTALAGELAATGDFETLATMLEQIEAESPLPLLIGRIDDQIGERLEKIPDGASGLLSQCIFAPHERSFAVAHRTDLAKISVYLLEAAHAQQMTNQPRLDAILAYNGYIARRILDALDGRMSSAEVGAEAAPQP